LFGADRLSPAPYWCNARRKATLPFLAARRAAVKPEFPASASDSALAAPSELRSSTAPT
jgi:hypothetical protein